jgi:16S rRNA G1207 methylase RsmC
VETKFELGQGISHGDRAIDSDRTNIPPYPQEALLVDAIAEMAAWLASGGQMPPRRVICTSPGLAQFAGAAAQAMPDAAVSCTYLDLYRENLAVEHWRDPPANLRIECAANLPSHSSEEDGLAGIVALPLSASGEAELTRELIQAGHKVLRIGGKLYASTDNRDDTWLGEQLRRLFGTLERRRLPTGALYIGTKTEPLKKVKNFACEFAFRDRGRLIRVMSRPGVFSHRSMDAGARQLIEEMEIGAGDRVLDIGCGAGVVALAAACRAEGLKVHAVDSNARAVECTRRGAELNGLTSVKTELNATGNYKGGDSFDVALANPPYYAGFRIARHFLTAARDALTVGGKVFVVTKHPEWYAENMCQWFNDISAAERKGYHVFQGARREDTE